MKSNLLERVSIREQLNCNNLSDCFIKKNPSVRAGFKNYSNQNHKNSVLINRCTGGKDMPISSLWISKIGERVVGVARLVQNGPLSAKIVAFRIDLEWRHTKIALDMMKSIQNYCQEHRLSKVYLHQNVVPSWMMGMMNLHGFKCME